MDIKLDHITFTTDTMQLHFRDGGRCTIPLRDFPRLLNATVAEREQWELIGINRGIHWPAVDEDLSLPRLLEEYAAPVAPFAASASNNSTEAHF